MKGKFVLVKLGVRLLSSMGVWTVVGNAIKATTPSDLNLANKILVEVGKFVLSSMVTDAADNYMVNFLNTAIPTKAEQVEPTK